MSGPARVEVVVPATAAGTRLDRFLATVPELPTRSQAKHLVDAGLVTVDGTVRKASFALPAGARVAIDVPAPAPLEVEPEDLPLVVLLDDPAFLAIDKPPGMAAHPGPGTPRGTVVNAVLHRLGPLDGVGDPDRPGIVHRLDKDTSGVMLVARTAVALAALGRQFHDRTVRKTYVAVVHGAVRDARGRIDRPIGRHPTERKRMSVNPRRGRSAVTEYEVLERFDGATLLALHPHTGRTHQLRVHLSSIGHPIVGDAVYGGRGGRGRRVLAEFPRQALHAAELRFRHPLRDEALTAVAPWPADIVALLDALRRAEES